MAVKVQVVLVDDIDGTEAVETVTFGVDGAYYEIDLSSENAQKFRKTLAVYVEHARKTSGTQIRRRRLRNGAGREQSARIRAWAKSHGHTINTRGRIPSDIILEYEAASMGSARQTGSGNAPVVSVSYRDLRKAYSHERDVQKASEFIIDIYLDTDDVEITENAFVAIQDLAVTLGVQNLTPGPSWHGSILQRFTGSIRDSTSQKEVKERLHVLEDNQSLQPDTNGSRQAADPQLTAAFTAMCDAIKDVPRACIRLGSLIVIKYPDDSGVSTLITRELTQAERLIIEGNPQLQKNPESLLDVLALTQ